MRNYYVPGAWNVICDRCGFRFKNQELKKEWTGLMVCSCCLETRHPQTLLKASQDEASSPWARPEPTDTFISISDILITESGDPILPETVEIALTTES